MNHRLTGTIKILLFTLWHRIADPPPPSFARPHTTSLRSFGVSSPCRLASVPSCVLTLLYSARLINLSFPHLKTLGKFLKFFVNISAFNWIFSNFYILIFATSLNIDIFASIESCFYVDTPSGTGNRIVETEGLISPTIVDREFIDQVLSLNF